MKPEALLTHAAFLRSLSRALVSDLARADDLVQETWLTALQRPPTREASTRAWLARVLRNKAADDRRRESRRRARERSSAREDALPSTAQIAEREAASRRVVDAVFRLSEPYRSAVLHRYYEDLPPREIARRQQVPVETVRTRLKRGLQRLRRDLEKDFGQSGTLSIAALAGLGDPMGSASASTAATTATASTATTSTFHISKALSLGGFAMSTKTTAISLSAALLLTACSGYLYTQLRSETRRADQLAGDLRDLESTLADSHAEIAALERHLEDAAGRENDLLALVERTKADSAEREAAARERAEKIAAVASTSSPPIERRPPYVLDSIDEADQVAAEMVRRGDLEGLWLLAADLLQMGEEGYEKVLEVGKLVTRENAGAIQALWRHEEMLMGRFFRSLGEHHEDVLRFRLYLESKNREELPELPAHLLLDPEAEAVLLGHYRGEDTDLLNDYVELYRKRLPGAKVRERPEIVRALAQIPTERAADLLVDSLEGAPAELQIAIVQSLAWQRTPRALPALRSLLETAQDSKLVEVLRAAIQYLE